MLTTSILHKKTHNDLSYTLKGGTKGGQQRLNPFEFVKLVIFFVSIRLNTFFFFTSLQHNVPSPLTRVRACKKVYNKYDVCTLCWLIKIITCQTSIGLLWWRNILYDKNVKVHCGFPFFPVVLALLNSMQKICRQVTMIHIPQAVEFVELTF